MAFAENTKVSVEKSVAEIVTMIRRHEGSQVGQLDDDRRYIIGFTMLDRQVRFTVSFLDPGEEQFCRRRRNAHSWEQRTPTQAREAWEQHRRQRMRALMLVIKAKLESVESEVETFEQAFLANVVMPDGKTLHEHVQPRIATAYETGNMPLLLEGPQ